MQDKNKKLKRKLLCPICKGEKIKPATMTGLAIYGSPDQRYVCEDCGYIGSLILDVSEQEESESDVLMMKDLEMIKEDVLKQTEQVLINARRKKKEKR